MRRYRLVAAAGLVMILCDICAAQNWSWWPGPTPPEIRDSLMKKRYAYMPNGAWPTEQDLKKIEEAAPEKPPAEPAKPRKILVWGRLWRHPANAFTQETLKILGKKSGAFEVAATDDPKALLPESLEKYDAIFFNGLHDRHAFLPGNLKELPEDKQTEAKQLDMMMKQSILEFVMEDGKGVAGIEGAMCALQDWKEWGELIGSCYGGHYVAKNVIKIEDPDHPLTTCFEGNSFEIQDQCYVPKEPYSRKKLKILLSLDLSKMQDPAERPKMGWIKPNANKIGRDYAVSWIKTHGRGRVFYCSLGVNHRSYFNPKFLAYLLAGTQFALGDLEGETAPSEK